MRVVSLGPSVTETIYQLGQGAALVGRSSACDYPAEAKAVPVVGNFASPFIEKVAAVRPNYVIATDFKDWGAKKMLEGLGIKVIILPGKTLGDYLVGVKTLGEVLGCQKAAAAEIARFSRALADFRKHSLAIPREKRPRVYIEVWHQPYQTCGGKTFISEMIEYAGGINLAAAEPKEYFRCSEEWILSRNPDVIISPGMGSGQAGQVRERRGWSEVSAVKHNRIYTGLDQSVIFRLGPRSIDGIELFRHCINGAAPGR